MKENGVFRKRKGFSIIPNEVARNKNLSQKAKGLYLHIMSYITLESFKLTKSFLMSESMEGEKAFDKSWTELKSAGYLKVYFIRAERGRWITEYELLEEASEPDTHTFYCDQNGNITSTNVDRAKKKSEGSNETLEPELDDSDRTPKKGVTVDLGENGSDRTPQNGTYRHGSNGKGGNNSNTDYKTLNNTNNIQFNSIHFKKSKSY